MLCIAIGFAQLTRVAPNAGSSYSWIRMAFGERAGAYARSFRLRERDDARRVDERGLGSFGVGLDTRSEPLGALAAAGALTAVLNASSVFSGLPFICSAGAAVRLFSRRREAFWGGVAAPFVGLLTVGAVVDATIAFEDRFLAYIALSGVCLGISFALWRGSAAAKAAGTVPGHCEPTALAPPL